MPCRKIIECTGILGGFGFRNQLLEKKQCLPNSLKLKCLQRFIDLRYTYTLALEPWELIPP